MGTITIELSQDQSQALEEIAARTGSSPAELVHEALRGYLVEKANPADDSGWPRSIGMIDDPDAPPADRIEEWLKENWRPEEDWGRS